MADPIRARNYTCYSPFCDGVVKGLDMVPKMFGIAATCWACGSDLYTVPRFGAPDTAVAVRPGVTKKLLTNSSGISFTGAYGWMQSFAGLIVSRPQNSSPDSD